jgi:Sulfotransferase domain
MWRRRSPSSLSDCCCCCCEINGTVVTRSVVGYREKPIARWDLSLPNIAVPPMSSCSPIPFATLAPISYSPEKTNLHGYQHDEGARRNRSYFLVLLFYVGMALLAILVFITEVDFIIALISESEGSAMYIAEEERNSIGANTSSIILPNFLLAGAQKAGTSALASWLYLGGHGICSSKPLTNAKYHDFQKEVHFFDNADQFNQGSTYYRSLFSHCSSSDLVMDATPDYAIHPKRIRDFYNSPSSNLQSSVIDLKVIMILRDPVSRELSWYNHKKDTFFKAKNRTDTQAFWSNIVKDPSNGTAYSFDEYTDKFLLRKLPGVRKTKEGSCDGQMCRSVYSIFLRQWFEWMPRDQILILSYDEFMSDPLTLKERVSDFLGLQHKPQAELTKVNTHSNPEKTTLPSCRTRDRLERVFNRWNEELYALLERHPGPPMEQRPFPKFKTTSCQA